LTTRDLGGSTGSRGVFGAQAVKGTAGGGGAPAAAAMARRAVGDDGVDAVGREKAAPFYRARARG
jgi:hypothetical protein